MVWICLLPLQVSVLAVIATCFIASANYTINEWLDSEFDRHHPVKKLRPSAMGKIEAKYVYTQWLLLAMLGLLVGLFVGEVFVIYEIILLIMGLGL